MRRLLILAGVLGVPAAGFAQDPVVALDADDVLARQLAAMVRDPRGRLWARVEAAKSLGKLGPRATAAVPDLTLALTRLRGGELEPLQEAVIDALGEIGYAARAALPAFARASGRTTDIDQAVKRASDQILNSPDSQDVDSLVRQLRSRDSSQRLRAVKALGNLGPAARFSVPNLLDSLADTDADVRRAALAAIRQIVPDAKPTEAIVRAIAADLTDPDPNVRLTAARALGRMGPAAAVAAPALEALREDLDPDVRRAAVDALGRLGP